ncbi:MAG: cellulase family glycosylhydrolase [Chitinophagaceae bacterium]|nr:cellulase family glycosylhydrolase [Chitinophagaceae bacterium]
MIRVFLLLLFGLLSYAIHSQERFIGINKSNPAYFSFTDGTTYIPIGINMINPSGRNGNNPDSAFAEIESWMRNLSENGGNYVRIWLSQSFWDVELKAGQYDEKKAERIDKFIALARKYHLRIKLTLEHFRSITLEENPQGWATKFAYHKSNGGPLDSIGQYLSTAKGRKLFLDKVEYYQKRYGSDTLFFGWELWNEMNAVKGPEDEVFWDWNDTMLKVVKEKFHENLVMQSLGSFDGDYAKPLYERLMKMPGNEVAQVHRYLDPGAPMEVCHAPMDVICASAVRDLQAYHAGKPILLAETGAVEPGHAGPSKYYPKDTAGILLHDILFAPFFTGSAGTGMSWHWESYVHKNNLWFHFGRFNESIKGVDPVKEGFVPEFSETDHFRIYSLKGKSSALIWIRDKNSDWRTELDQGVAASVISKAVVRLPVFKRAKSVDVYDPWKNQHVTIDVKKNSIALPDFRRSLVVRVSY